MTLPMNVFYAFHTITYPRLHLYAKVGRQRLSYQNFLSIGRLQAVANACPKACVASDNGKLYMCQASDVATLEKDTLKIVAQLPAELM